MIRKKDIKNFLSCGTGEISLININKNSENIHSNLVRIVSYKTSQVFVKRHLNNDKLTIASFYNISFVYNFILHLSFFIKFFIEVSLSKRMSRLLQDT